jgi:hypothetical protein
MNFGQLCAEVFTITGRPDLLAETQLAVRRATLFLHGFDTWFRDFNEKRIDFAASSYTFSISLRDNFTNFRKFRYIKPFDPATGIPTADIIHCNADDLWDEFKRAKKDIYYIAGDNVNIRTSCAQTNFIAGYYQLPNVQDAYYSWIADIYPYAIVEDAAGRILQMIGQIDEGNKFIDPQKGSVMTTHIPWLRANGLTPEA